MIKHRQNTQQELLWALLLALGCSLILYAVFSAVEYHWQWASIWKYRVLIVKGWGITLVISLAALGLSVVMAMVLMLLQRSQFVLLRLLARSCVEIIRGTPLLVQLLLGYYGFANALYINSSVFVGVFILALFEGAYLSEIFRGAWESIGTSQWEAARAVGFNRQQTWRYVIFPQAFRRALPGTAGQMVSLIKDSSLLSIIGVGELTQMVKAANAQAYTALEGYVPLALLYMAITLPLSWWSKSLEQRFKYDT